MVPAISGESVAHAYQQLLAQEMSAVKEPVCKYCAQGIFLKNTNESVLKESGVLDEKGLAGIEKPKDAKGKDVNDDLRRAELLEASIVGNCAVEDVGGFLYAGDPNVKRTSLFSTGYMTPVLEALSESSLDPQFHSRYALGTKYVEGGKKDEASGQMIYYVEVGSAVYGFSFDLDTRFVGRHTYVHDKYGQLVEGMTEQRVDLRSLAAVDALERMLVEWPVGAKKTRFNPQSSWESVVVAVSQDVWTVPSPLTMSYVRRAAAKLKKINHGTKVAAYCEGGCDSAAEGLEFLGSPEELAAWMVETSKGIVEGKPGT